MTTLTQNPNESVNSILQYGRVVGKDCCVVFSASRFPYLILCPRQWKGKVATTYLYGLKTIKIFQYENLLLLKALQITRNDIHNFRHSEKIKIITFSSYIPEAFSDMVKYFCE